MAYFKAKNFRPSPNFSARALRAFPQLLPPWLRFIRYWAICKDPFQQFSAAGRVSGIGFARLRDPVLAPRLGSPRCRCSAGSQMHFMVTKYFMKRGNVAKKKKNGGQNDALKKLMKVGLLSKLA